MKTRIMKRTALALVGLTALITSAIAFQQQADEAPTSVPGIRQADERSATEERGERDEYGPRSGYTHCVGTVVTDLNAGTGRALIRSRRFPTSTPAPIRVYEFRLRYLGQFFLFPYPGSSYSEFGYLFRVTNPVAPDLPSYFFISKYGDCGCHNIWTFRQSTGRWRKVGAFDRAPLDASVTP